MIGAILGDMIGAPYELGRGTKTKEFPLFSRASEFTDDSVMTIAVAEALMDSMDQSDDEIRTALVRSMRKWGRKYPDAGYGGMFYRWLHARHPKPYGSFGNGSAMRVAAAGWLYETMEKTRHAAKLTAEVTHNHPEGIKGAEATAAAIFLARTGSTKKEIIDYIIGEFDYDLSRTCDEIRPTYHHVETCQETVPEAITAFWEGTDFEDVIRTAVSLGGDADTLTCIAGGIAEAFYGVPKKIEAEGRKRLPDDILEVLDRFIKLTEDLQDKRQREIDPFLDGNEEIDEAISAFYAAPGNDSLDVVLKAFRKRILKDGHLLVPVVVSEDGQEFKFRLVDGGDGQPWPVAFTSPVEYRGGEKSDILSLFIDQILETALQDEDMPGFIINPWGKSFRMTNELIRYLFSE